MTINLHELINQPGYGKAEKALRAAGKWRLTPVEIIGQIKVTDCTDEANDAIQDAIIELHTLEGNQ